MNDVEMRTIKGKEYKKLTKLIYCDLPILLQKILCSSCKCVGCDGLEEDFEYVKNYVNETKKVANLTLDGQLATFKKIINEN